MNIPIGSINRVKSQAIAPYAGKQKTLVMEMKEEDFVLDAERMEQFVKENTKMRYISEKPKPQQLYFLYKLIMNRKKFKYSLSDRFLTLCGKFSRCCRKNCARRYSVAEKH